MTAMPGILLLCAVGVWPFPWPSEKIAHYTAYRVERPIAVDGTLDERR